MPDRNAQGWTVEGPKENSFEQRVQDVERRTRKRRFHDSTRVVEHRHTENERGNTERHRQWKEGDSVREYHAVHEDKFLSCWLMEETEKQGRRSVGKGEEDARRRDKEWKKGDRGRKEKDRGRS